MSGGLVRDIFLAREVADEDAALEGVTVADGAAKHGITLFERIEDGRDGNRGGDVERDLWSTRARLRRGWKDDAACRSLDHGI